MAEERIDIVVSQRGAREVKRDLESIGQGAASSISNLDRLKGALQGFGTAASSAKSSGDMLRDAMGAVGISADLSARGMLRMTTALGAAQAAMEATWGATVRLSSASTALIGPLTSTGTALTVVARNSAIAVQQLNLLRSSFEQLRVSGGGAQRLLIDAATSARDITPNMNAVSTATNNAARGFAAVGGGAGGAVPPINNLGAALGGLGGAANSARLSFFSLWRVLLAYTVIHQMTRAVLQSIDSWIMLSNRLRQVSTDSQNLIETQENIYEAAQRTRSSLEDMATLYTRTSMAVEKLNLSQKEILDITETVAMAMKLNGGSVQETASAMRQLSQAFNKGKLDGDEFRSIMENAPPLMKLFSDSLGVTKGELMKMASDGNLSIELLIKALQEGGNTIRQDFAGSLATTSEGFEYLSNTFVKFIGQLNEATGFSQGFYAALKAIADNLDVVMAALGVLGVAIAAAFGPPLVAMLASFGATLTVSLGPIGLVATAVAGVAALIGLWYSRTLDATGAARVHKGIVDELRNAYEGSAGAVEDWADKIEGATRSQVVAALQTAKENLNQLQAGVPSVDEDAIGQLISAGGGNNELLAQMNELVGMFSQGGLEVDVFKRALQELKEANPEIPDGLIAKYQDYADTVKATETNVRQLTAAWTLMGENVPDALRTAAENVLGVKKDVDSTVATMREAAAVLPELTASDRTRAAAAAEKLATEQAVLTANQENLIVTELLKTAGEAAVRSQEKGLEVATRLQEKLLLAVQAQGTFNNTAMSDSISVAVGYANRLVTALREAAGIRATPFSTPSAPRADSVVPASFSTPTFATGGSFTVGGAGGVDSQLVQFNASPGERVSVGRAGQTQAGGDYSVGLALEELERETAALRINNEERAIQEDLVSRVNRLREAGATLSPIEITQLEEATRKMASLRDQTDLFGSAIDRVMSGAENAIADFVKKGTVDFSDLISSMVVDIARLAAQQYIIKPLSNVLGNVVNGLLGGLTGGGLNLFGGGAAAAPAFATGGGFTVGGSGGVDSQLVQLRASPGERVSVSRAGQASEGGNGSVTNVFNITTPDVKGFKASETQIAARMARLANRGTRNA